MANAMTIVERGTAATITVTDVKTQPGSIATTMTTTAMERRLARITKTSIPGSNAIQLHTVIVVRTIQNITIATGVMKAARTHGGTIATGMAKTVTR